MTNFCIENEYLSVRFSCHGAEMHSFFDKHRKLECLWQADAKYWARHAPILFPIVGRLNGDALMVRNQHYSMGQHGFARDSVFSIHHHDAKNIHFKLMSSEKSLMVYPFQFEFFVEYQLRSNKLITTFCIQNSSPEPLPVSIGAHPAFNWPLLPHVTRSQHHVVFEFEEHEPIRQLKNGLLLNEKIPNPLTNNQLQLEDSLFENDALIFDQLRSRKICYSANNEMSITLNFNDFPHLGLWTKPGAPFVCLEPWQGFADPIGFHQDFAEKPGLMFIQKNSEIRKSFEIMLD